MVNVSGLSGILCRLRVAWEGLGREDHFPKARARPTQAPTWAPAFLSDARLGQRDHQGLWILINNEPESTRGLKRGLPYNSNAQGPAASRVAGPGQLGKKERATFVAVGPTGFQNANVV